MPFITVNNVNLYYEEEGRGEPLLMIQGLGYDHRPFAWLRAGLKEHMRLVLFDNRGAGRSDAPDGPYTVEQMAGDAAALLGALGIERAAVLGISLGGSIAQMMALRHPDRVGRLIVGCSYFSGNPAKIRMPKETLDILTKREGTAEQIARRGLGIAFSDDYPARNPEVFEKLVRWRVQDPITPEGYFAQLQAGLGFDVENEVCNIAAPTLILHGDADRVVPADRGREL
ncbi:MAG: alpha/beta hydrolase, partial [Pseudomonadota bacterium]